MHIIDEFELEVDFIVYSNSIRNHAVIQEYNTLAYNSLINKLGTGMCPTPPSALGPNYS